MLAPSRKIYLSYRRADLHLVWWLYERLAQQYGTDGVFVDVAEVKAGQDIAQVLRDAVRSSEVVLALIGPSWASADGLQRLADPGDWIRTELAAALRGDSWVVPVLLGETELPSPAELPPDLRPLADLQVVRLSPDRMERDVAGLLATLDRIVEPSPKGGRTRRQADRRSEATRGRRKRGPPPKRPEDKAQIELDSWEELRETGTADDLRDHIARFPGGRTEEWARARLAKVVWDELGDEPSPEDLENYVAEFPTSPHAVEARERLQPRVSDAPAPARSGVFISYRRDDARLWALLLYASIAQRLGRDRVFLDTVNIPFGEDYAAYIRRELPGYGVAVVLMGPGWLGERPDGPPRIEDADDLFRIELELAIRHDLTIMPVTLDGLAPPHDQVLPDSISAIARKNMFPITAGRFEEESPRLLSAIEEHHQRTTGGSDELGGFIAGAGFGADNRTLLGNVDRLLQTKLDRALRRFYLGATAIGALVAALVVGAVWVMIRG